MKKLLIILLLLLSSVASSAESIGLEIKSNNDLVKQGDVGLYSLVISGEKLNPIEIRSVISKPGLVKGLFIAQINSEDIGINQIEYKALATIYDKEISTSAKASVNNKDFNISVKYFSIVELKDKQDQLQILNQLGIFNIWPWIGGLLLILILIILFVKRKEIIYRLNAKANIRLKKEFLHFEKKIGHAVTLDELDLLKNNLKKFQSLNVKKILSEELENASSKETLEKVYQKRKEFYLFELMTKKQLTEFENKMNKIQYKPTWDNESLEEIVDLFKNKKGRS